MSEDLTKLNRDELNKVAVDRGISDAADEGKYNTKADLVKAIQDQGNDQSDNQDEQAPSTQDSDPRGDSRQDELEQAGQPNAGDDKAGQEEQDLSVPQADPPAIDSPDDVDDQSGVEDAPGPSEDDEPEDEEEEPTPRATRRGADQGDEEGMGFPRKDGKTLSIFSNKPHEVVRNVAGVMVPMTREEAVGDSTKGVEPKTDAEAIAKLKKLGKL